MITVIHSNHLHQGPTAVALVNTDCLEEAFRLTNNIDGNSCWLQNPEVIMLVDGGACSTSVGDVMIHNNRYYNVSPQGFTLFYKPTLWSFIKGLFS